MNIIIRIAVVLVFATLTACGGGGGSSTTTPSNTAQSPAPITNDSPIGNDASTTGGNVNVEEPTSGNNPPVTESSPDTDVPSDAGTDGDIQTGSNVTPTPVVNPPPTPSMLALSWTIPTAREDGSYMPVYEIAGYEIRYSKNQGVDVTIVHINDPQTTDWVLENAEPGQYAFSIATIDAEGVYSEFSTEATASVQ